MTEDARVGDKVHKRLKRMSATAKRSKSNVYKVNLNSLSSPIIFLALLRRQ